MRSRTVVIFLFDGAQPLDFTGPYDAFTGAARYHSSPDGPPYVVRTASIGRRPVRLAGGLTVLPDLDIEDVRRPDILLVPGGPGAEVPNPEVAARLRTLGPEAERLASVCTGSLLLAEAGLLDGKRATTHWSFCGHFAQAYPRVHVQRYPIFVEDDGVFTSAGVTAGIDLALALIEEDCGRELALRVARLLVVFVRRPGHQAQFSAQLAVQSSGSTRLRDVRAWIADHLDEDLSVTALAERTRMSARHFARLFLSETGTTPGHYVEQVRVEAAQRMLTDTPDNVDRIARRCGWGTSEAMRRAFVRQAGESPAGYRQRNVSWAGGSPAEVRPVTRRRRPPRESSRT
ncbi:GlxA family transcriptional regulator [Cryptosporangium arvum]|uniref:Transcriptional regulator containing an amidase domain and an AraC-type DNA-binding HTH domain n=1 Tax=Cryptosporangium arvum DSM 44712 TaxID=927661 RepID=A0A010ZZC0_9ACTN|nr:GlxA family transcriptional regulator [Cryptosporangium arvum]EXG82567.1 transcriptional regulator containing an amidase domain and an AraC-type DNA-binding HTH domain [Cryptosporangium arvum DSM 44712]